MPHSTCVAVECSRPAQAEYCEIHSGPGRIRRGRRFIYMPQHRLADSRGGLPYARKVLWDTLGQPDTSLCHWCGVMLDWVTGEAVTRVQADHMNHDKLDDRPENLVPSCGSCNAQRSDGNEPTGERGRRCWRRNCERLLARRGHSGECPD